MDWPNKWHPGTECRVSHQVLAVVRTESHLVMSYHIADIRGR